MTPDEAKALREPFKPEQIGKLPKAGIQLDYVGHASVTDRLLQVDPEWTWEPMALASPGVPAVDSEGNLWIRLTVCGVTRLGVGDGRNMKERIGDAIRNAAMRFGVALDLWAKEPLHVQEHYTDPDPEDDTEPTVPMTASQQTEIARLSADLSDDLRGELNNWYRAQGFPPRKKLLSKDQADEVIYRLNELIVQQAAQRQEAPV